ncbi:MAG: phenylalanine--tRNA ligase subunit beta [Lachnospiraceae bacterium]|nr:phenylalanine--tRNA ligase subunit beta [Lachnospiraceae bacterium]
MNTSLNWIKEYVPDLNCTAQEYTDAMTLSGTKVEGYECLAEDLEKIVVGKILSIDKHPDADKLVICQVDIGQSAPIQIVTGAPNVVVNALVPVVLDGGKVACDHDRKRVPGGVKIKKGKLRGVESNGMMCSIDELGSSHDYYPEAPEDGIYLFPENAGVKPGDDAVKALGLDDVTHEYEITSNRVDCYATIGIAREAAATFGKEFKFPVIKETGNNEKASDYIKVTIKDEKLCPRYIARVVKNVKIGPSPTWMQRRLKGVGIRPINNIVDITNYVMEEFGQPMHAYDLSTIEGNEIIVRTAADGEKFTTLDGREHELSSDILMICDGKKPVGVAGIMGGENSMITDSVKTVLFEAACFDGTNIRLSSKKLGMRTDASGKFEKGLDPNTALLAVNRACQLMEELNAGEVVGGMVDVYPQVRTGNEVEFNPERINKLLGTSIDKDTMIKYFEKIELEYDEKKNVIKVPSWRQDVHCMADLAEEVARFYGYDKIPTTIPDGESTIGGFNPRQIVYANAKNAARFNGFSEAMCFSFESPKVFDKLLIPENSELRQAIIISNPLGEDYSIMRTISLNGILSSLALNYAHRNKEVSLFEMANVYLPHELPLKDLPEERMKLTLGTYGSGDFFTLKGSVVDILTEAGVREEARFTATKELPFLHPGRAAVITCGKKDIGFMGEVHPIVLSNYGIKEKVYVAVIDMLNVAELSDYDIKFKGLAKFPAITRDLSLLTRKDVTCGQIEECINKHGGEYLESIELFDVYEGERIMAGFKSLAYSIAFRAKDKTLEDTIVNERMDKIIKELKNLGAELRQ